MLLITFQQREFISLLFSFRYARRVDFQKYFRNKTPHHINRQLKYLADNLFIKSVNQTDRKNLINYPQKVYCLGRRGIRLVAQSKNLQARDLKNRYRDSKRSDCFVTHWLLVAEIFLQLREEARKTKTALTFQPKTDFEEDSVLVMLHPDAYIIEENENSRNEFFLEIIDQKSPRFVLRRRVRQYTKYFLNNSVEVETGEDFPIVLLVCPSEKVKRILQKYIGQRQDEEGAEALVFKLTTYDKIQSLGIAGSIWTRVGES